jgi:hypothetical protein
MGFENGRLVRVAVRAVSNATGDQQVNTFHYDLVDSAIPGENPNTPQTLADTFRDVVIPTFRALYTSSWTVQPVVVAEERDPQNPLAARSEWVSGSALAGTKAAPTDLLPQACCAVAAVSTDHIGKRFRGRLFLGGSIGEIDQSAGVWQSGATTLWAAYMAAIPHQPDLATGVSLSVANWVIYSRTQRAADLDPYASIVQAATVRSKVRWLRSREP